ncbi:MAG: transcriptional repressor [Actinomycetota bacterium]|nr:transcriptional repressor [Actinomycetota bacterium]
MQTDQAAARVLEMLRLKGLRVTPQRRAIVSEVMRAQDHINAGHLATLVAQRVPGVNASTVYRTLGLLDELGVLVHAHFEDGVEYHRAPEAGHVHLTCSSCGRNDSLPRSEVQPLERHLLERHGFSADLTHFAISGMCERCRSKQAT